MKLERHRASNSISDRYRIQVLDRAVRILDCFGFDHLQLSVSEIGIRTGLHKSTTHRILMALEYNDLIKQNPETGKYHLGIKLFKLGNQAVLQFDLREICRPFLMRLMDKTKETVHLAAEAATDISKELGYENKKEPTRDDIGLVIMERERLFISAKSTASEKQLLLYP